MLFVNCGYIRKQYNRAMANLDTNDFRLLENALETIAADGIPKAMRDTLNMTAANAMKTGRRMAQENFVIKGSKTNNLAVRGVQFDKAKTLNPTTMQSVVGHTADFWPKQEDGATEVSTGKHGVPIPTGAAANQFGTSTRTKRVVARNYINKHKFAATKRTPKTRNQANVFAAQDAVNSGVRVAYMDFGRRKGIFRLKGGRKGTKRGWPKGAKLQMIHDLSYKSVRIPASPLIFPAAERQAKFIPENYERALKFQIKKTRRALR